MGSRARSFPSLGRAMGRASGQRIKACMLNSRGGTLLAGWLCLEWILVCSGGSNSPWSRMERKMDTPMSAEAGKLGIPEFVAMGISRRANAIYTPDGFGGREGLELLELPSAPFLPGSARMPSVGPPPDTQLENSAIRQETMSLSLLQTPPASGAPESSLQMELGKMAQQWVSSKGSQLNSQPVEVLQREIDSLIDKWTSVAVGNPTTVTTPAIAERIRAEREEETRLLPSSRLSMPGEETVDDALQSSEDNKFIDWTQANWIDSEGVMLASQKALKELSERLDKEELSEVWVDPDGDSFFMSLAQQLALHPTIRKALEDEGFDFECDEGDDAAMRRYPFAAQRCRAEVASYLSTQPGLLCDIPQDQHESYVSAVRISGSWCGLREVKAAAMRFQVEVVCFVVWQGGLDEVHYPPPQQAKAVLRVVKCGSHFWSVLPQSVKQLTSGRNSDSPVFEELEQQHVEGTANIMQSPLAKKRDDIRTDADNQQGVWEELCIVGNPGRVSNPSAGISQGYDGSSRGGFWSSQASPRRDTALNRDVPADGKDEANSVHLASGERMQVQDSPQSASMDLNSSVVSRSRRPAVAFDVSFKDGHNDKGVSISASPNIAVSLDSPTDDTSGEWGARVSFPMHRSLEGVREGRKSVFRRGKFRPVRLPNDGYGEDWGEALRQRASPAKEACAEGHPGDGSEAMHTSLEKQTRKTFSEWQRKLRSVSSIVKSYWKDAPKEEFLVERQRRASRTPPSEESREGPPEEDESDASEPVPALSSVQKYMVRPRCSSVVQESISSFGEHEMMEEYFKETIDMATPRTANVLRSAKRPTPPPPQEAPTEATQEAERKEDSVGQTVGLLLSHMQHMEDKRAEQLLKMQEQQSRLTERFCEMMTTHSREDEHREKALQSTAEAWEKASYAHELERQEIPEGEGVPERGHNTSGAGIVNQTSAVRGKREEGDQKRDPLNHTGISAGEVHYSADPRLDELEKKMQERMRELQEQQQKLIEMQNWQRKEREAEDPGETVEQRHKPVQRRKSTDDGIRSRQQGARGGDSHVTAKLLAAIPGEAAVPGGAFLTHIPTAYQYYPFRDPGYGPQAPVMKFQYGGRDARAWGQEGIVGKEWGQADPLIGKTWMFQIHANEAQERVRRAQAELDSVMQQAERKRKEADRLQNAMQEVQSTRERTSEASERMSQLHRREQEFALQLQRGIPAGASKRMEDSMRYVFERGGGREADPIEKSGWFQEPVGKIREGDAALRELSAKMRATKEDNRRLETRLREAQALLEARQQRQNEQERQRQRERQQATEQMQQRFFMPMQAIPSLSSDLRQREKYWEVPFSAQQSTADTYSSGMSGRGRYQAQSWNRNDDTLSRKIEVAVPLEAVGGRMLGGDAPGPQQLEGVSRKARTEKTIEEKEQTGQANMEPRGQGARKRKGGVGGSFGRANGTRQVERLLAEVGLSGYEKVLVRNGWDTPQRLKLITEDDLVDLGVKKGHARVMVECVAQILKDS